MDKPPEPHHRDMDKTVNPHPGKVGFADDKQVFVVRTYVRGNHWKCCNG